MDTFTPTFTLNVVYGSISFALYTATIVMVFTKKKVFSGSFFILYKANYFINLLTFLNSFIGLRIPQSTCKNCTLAFLFESHSATNYSSFPLYIVYCILISMAYIQYTMIFLVSLNRFMMFVYIYKNDKYWTKASPYILLITCLFPLSQTFSVLTNRAYYQYQPDIDGYKTATEANISAILSSLLICMVVTTFAAAVLNLASWKKLASMSKQLRKNDKNLFYMSCASFIIQLLAFLDTVLIQIVKPAGAFSMWSGIAKTAQPFISDGLTLSQPWILIGFSSLSRKELMKMCSGKAYREETSIMELANQKTSSVPRRVATMS